MPFPLPFPFPLPSVSSQVSSKRSGFECNTMSRPLDLRVFLQCVAGRLLAIVSHGTASEQKPQAE